MVGVSARRRGHPDHGVDASYDQGGSGTARRDHPDHRGGARVRIELPTVGDQGELPRSLPELFIPNLPITWQTFTIIAPFALAMALVGLLESLMTAKLVDEITDTHSRKSREAWAQGAANILSGFFGGMGLCAMIGQTMINVRASGARTRISTLLAGAFLLVPSSVSATSSR